MRSPIGADIYNPSGRQAYAQFHDCQWQAADKPPFSSWVARTIFLHSLTQGTSSGIRRTELNLSLLTPGLEASFIDQALDKLAQEAWYLDNDPITTLSRFKEEPSINKIVTEEKEQVGRTEAKDYLRERRDSVFAKKIFTPVFAPESSGDVDDIPDEIALCLIDFNEATVKASTDSPPDLVQQIFENTGESGKFRLYRNRLLFLVANQQELDRAIDNAREYQAIQNILGSQTRLEDLSETQQKQLKERKGAKDLEVRISLTNAYRHLFYPAKDDVKAPNGLMHYTLPTQDSSTVKGKNNQQDVILKALKDCEKIRSGEKASQPFAPAYILQKVWSRGLENWSTKALRDAFAKDIRLNILLQGELNTLRETIRNGLQGGQWDLKVGDAAYIKTDGILALPDTIEFSERMLLYRRGILIPPEPRVIELNAQVMADAGESKEVPVRVRWRAKGALKVSLQIGSELIPEEFRPSDEYEAKITETTIFRLVANYGEGEIAEQETQAIIAQPGRVKDTSGVYDPNGGNGGTGSVFEYQSPNIELDGTVNKVFNDLADLIGDRKIKTIKSFEISVDQVIDYRKLGTTIPLLSRFPVSIEQTAMLQTGNDQFVKLEYQGQVKGFQSFFGTINGLLNDPDTQANVNLKLIIDFGDKPIATDGSELNSIQQALSRNPVERICLNAEVKY